MKKTDIVMYGHKRIPSREGGVEIVVKELAVRMQKRGKNVTCYNRMGNHVGGKEFNKAKSKYYKGVRLKSVWTIPFKGLAAMTSSFFASLLASFSSARVVHVHSEGPAATCFIPKLFGKKVIVTIHGLDWQRAKWGNFASKYIRFGEKQAVKHADAIIVLSKNVRDYFWKTYHRKTYFVPNGVNRPRIREAELIKERFGLEKNRYVLFVGRIVPEKGVRYLLEAWKNVNTEKKLVIAGSSSDSKDFFDEMKDLSSKNVLFTGFMQGRELEELYSNAYLYVLPSDLEGMPLSLLEAMSYGNCCLTSDIPECTEVTEDHALTFHKGNTEELKEILQELLNDEKLVSRYREGAADYICNKFHWDDIVDKTLRIYGYR